MTTIAENSARSELTRNVTIANQIQRVVEGSGENESAAATLNPIAHQAKEAEMMLTVNAEIKRTEGQRRRFRSGAT